MILLTLKLNMTTDGVGFAIESVQFDKKFIGILYCKVYCISMVWYFINIAIY